MGQTGGSRRSAAGRVMPRHAGRAAQMLSRLFRLVSRMPVWAERRCCFCRAPFLPSPPASSAGERWLCPDCRPRFAPHDAGCCRLCGRPVGPERGDMCQNCLHSPPPWDAYAWHGPYRADLRALLLEFKFHGRVGLAPFFADMLVDAAAVLPPCDIIVPMPSHAVRLRERGYNQTCVLAGELSRRMAVPLSSGLLVRVRDAPHQTRLNAAARRQAPRGSFAAGSAEGLKVLLLDDIMTTGATASHAARCLLDAGAASVRLLTVARTGL